MTAPRWFSQPYPPDGASAAEGIRNQLGRPELDLLTILVRESAQNSWDARVMSSSDPVEYRIDMWTVSPAHASTWRELLGDGAPIGVDTFPLRDTLRNGSIRLLSVSDRGTRGLGGPTRADNAVGPDRDFVSFIRNIGEPRDTALGVVPTASAKASSICCPSPAPSSSTPAVGRHRVVSRPVSSAALCGRATRQPSPPERAAIQVATGGATPRETSSNPLWAQRPKPPPNASASRLSVPQRPGQRQSSSTRTWTNSNHRRRLNTWRRPSPGTCGQK